MQKDNLPQTSIQAYKSITDEMLTNHYGKILSCLKSIGKGTYEEISSHTGLEKHRVGRRVSELERMGVIYKPGEKRLTSSNRYAFVYKLVENGEISAQPEKILPGPSVGELARPLIQKSLF